MVNSTLKEKVCKAIDARAYEIIEVAEAIYKHPELGFKEFKTSELVEKKFRELGLEYRSKLALTGVKARLKGGRKGPTVAIIGELDSVVCYEHPHADRVTGAVHACGHHAQIAAMLGACIGLIDSGVMTELTGDVVFFAVPAEEYVELEFREKLREEGKIEFFGGKQELIRLGEFDDIDMAMMVHSMPDTPQRKAVIGFTCNGFIGKSIRFLGKAAHAGAAPHEGINALNAAMLALMGIHAQRETFKDEDSVRVHGIITKGGDLVNVVPADVRMEMYVRAKTTDAITSVSEKVDRAIKAGAMAVGAKVEITNIPGYLPLIQDKIISEYFKGNISQLIMAENVMEEGHFAWSTDMGDITHIMPGIHPMIGGFKGAAHSKDFEVTDPEMAYVIPAKAMAMTVIDLLADNAKLAKHVLEKFKPKMTKKEYLDFLRRFFKKE
jgi:amidohydrolase